MQRASGVLMHISSLPGDYSIGNFGKEGRDFVDLLSDCGFSYWQVLPFGLPDKYQSPYQSLGSFSIHPAFIDLELLVEKEYLLAKEIAGARQHQENLCEFQRLQKERYSLLRLAARRAGKEEVNRFLESFSEVLTFCRFMALKKKNQGKPWQSWQDLEPDEEEVFFWGFTQAEAFSQWQSLKAYANKRGIHIIGDVPIYVAIDSSDVFQHKEQFLLQENGLPRLVAGVPPDYFSPCGQLWNNPVYHWFHMKQENFTWWRNRISHSLSLFDAIRLDHFRGFASFWAVPYGEQTAESGRWYPGGGKAFIEALKQETKGRLCIVENLGHITPDVEELLTYSGFPGMAVLQFGLTDEASSHHFKNYTRHTVAYTGTHDNQTLAGFLQGIEPAQRLQLLSAFGETDSEKLAEQLISALWGSLADLVIFPVQDLLKLGDISRMNTPGLAEGNWGFRVSRQQLSALDRNRLKGMNQLFNRVPYVK